jgi:hypothetical protein
MEMSGWTYHSMRDMENCGSCLITDQLFYICSRANWCNSDEEYDGNDEGQHSHRQKGLIQLDYVKFRIT